MTPTEIPANANQGCMGPSSEDAGKAETCMGCPNQIACSSGMARKILQQVDPALEEIRDNMSSVKHKILILSGKGGVGKSTFTCKLGTVLANLGLRVGILDIDICGPSIPHILGVDKHEVRKSAYGWSPIIVNTNLCAMSVGFMLHSKVDAVIWRGPRKNGLIKQFLTDVYWDELDVLLIDSPPGTSDEHISITSYLREVSVDGAIIITTPQEVSLLDVRKEITFCNKVNLQILGVVENMSEFICPNCQHSTEIFAPTTGGARSMCKEMQVPFLGSLPISLQLLKNCETGMENNKLQPSDSITRSFLRVIEALFHSSPDLLETYNSISDTVTDIQLNKNV